jgi:uncharacterized FlaG/YvyC family protein
MTISRVQGQGAPLEASSSPITQVKAERATTAISAETEISVQKAEATSGSLAAKPVEDPTNVTVRRDSNGRVYYSVSDAKSGQEILEVPPKALRDVGQGIEEYIKEQQSKASAHVKVKA